MDFQIAWTAEGLALFEEIVTYVSNRSPTAGEKLRLEILGHIEVLRRFPRIGPVYKPDKVGDTRQIVCKSYRVFYRVIEDARKVEILSVWHGSRAEPEFPD